MRIFSRSLLLKRLEVIEKGKRFNSTLLAYDGIITTDGQFKGMKAEDIPVEYKIIHIVFTDA